MSSLTFDPALRMIPQLEVDDARPAQYTQMRIFKIALPVLALFKPIGSLAQAGLIVTDLTQITGCSTLQELYFVSVRIVGVVGLIFKPTFTALVCQTYDVAIHLLNAYQSDNCTQRNWALFNAVHGVIYIGALCTASKPVLLVSLVAQGFFEAKRSFTQVKNGLDLEALVHSALVFIKLRSAVYG
jgi:hypothetical protein